MSEERIQKVIFSCTAIVLLLCMAGAFWTLGRWHGRADRDKWWLDRITGKEFPVEGSVLRQISFGDSAVYCV